MESVLETPAVVIEKIPVAFYARVSSDEQAEGESVVHQFSFLDEYMKKYVDLECYSNEDLYYADEGVSGFSKSIKERPAIKRLITDARNGKFKMLLIKNGSRLSRNDTEIFYLPDLLESIGVRTIVCNEGFDSSKPNTRMFLLLSGFMGQRYSEEISMNVSIGMRQKAKAGQWATSVPPIGYIIKNRKLTPDNASKFIPILIFDMYVNQMVGTQEIAKKLRDMDVKTKRGNYYEKSHIRNILKNRVYVGDTIYGKTRNVVRPEYDENNNLESRKRVKKKVDESEVIFVPETHESLVDKYTYWRAQEIMRSRNMTPSHKSKAKHPLVGILYCAHCGASVVCQGRTAKKARYYRCSTILRYGKGSCELESIKADDIEKFVYNDISEQIKSFSKLDMKASGTVQSEYLNKRIREIESNRKKIVKNMIQKSDEQAQFEPYPDDVYREMMLGFKKQINDCDEQISVIQNQLEEISNSEKNTFKLTEIIERFDEVDFEDKVALRVMFHNFVDRIDVIAKKEFKKIRYKYSFA